MSKDPAFLFYSNDFLSGTFTMTDAQVGKYIRLLCLQHQKYELVKKDMMNICKTYDKDIFSKFECQDGKYYNVRLREEMNRRRAYSESRAKNRKVSKSYVKHMETEAETITEDVTKDDNKSIEVFHLIKDSPYRDFETFKKEALEDSELVALNADLKYYHTYWVSHCTANNKTAVNWFAEIKRYIISQSRTNNFKEAREASIINFPQH